MKTLYVIRHAKSSWDDPSLTDQERPLNKRGKRDAPFMAQLLRGKGQRPDLILSSPAVRALTTARHFAAAWDIPGSEIRIDPGIYEAHTGDIQQLITQLENDLEVVYLFGHNPTFTSFVNLFAPAYIPNLPTCGIVQLQAAVDSWASFNEQTARLVAFHYPKQYFPK
jgi:phosphohistidine phosphatase